jgi:hypothetical protein
MNIISVAKLILKVAKANPSLVISAVTAIAPIVRAVKASSKKDAAGRA